jgi:alpha-D-ribose 1-methylphosphonate 5-triphosphate synthase subunit PhnG
VESENRRGGARISTPPPRGTRREHRGSRATRRTRTPSSNAGKRRRPPGTPRSTIPPASITDAARVHRQRRARLSQTPPACITGAARIRPRTPPPGRAFRLGPPSKPRASTPLPPGRISGRSRPPGRAPRRRRQAAVPDAALPSGRPDTAAHQAARLDAVATRLQSRTLQPTPRNPDAARASPQGRHSPTLRQGASAHTAQPGRRTHLSPMTPLSDAAALQAALPGRRPPGPAPRRRHPRPRPGRRLLRPRPRAPSFTPLHRRRRRDGARGRETLPGHPRVRGADSLHCEGAPPFPTPPARGAPGRSIRSRSRGPTTRVPS